MKPYSDFHKDITRKDGYSYICKACRSKKKRKERGENRKILDRNIQESIRRAIKRDRSGYIWESLVGYTLSDLKQHLEKQFTKEMSWDNYGSYWWIDKIIPRSMYSYSKSSSEFKKCWSLKNMRPLEASLCKKKKDIFFIDLVKEYNLFDILPVGIIAIDKKHSLLYPIIKGE